MDGASSFYIDNPPLIGVGEDVELNYNIVLSSNSGQVICNSQITTKLVTDYTSKYTDLDESTIAILTDSINSTATAAITGGNMTNEAIKAVAKQGINQFKLTIDKLKDKGTTTNIKDSYDKMQVTATSIKSTEQTRDSNITAHNALMNVIVFIK